MQIYFHSRLCSYLSRVPILVEGTVCLSDFCLFWQMESERRRLSFRQMVVKGGWTKFDMSWFIFFAFIMRFETCRPKNILYKCTSFAWGNQFFLYKWWQLIVNLDSSQILYTHIYIYIYIYECLLLLHFLRKKNITNCDLFILLFLFVFSLMGLYISKFNCIAHNFTVYPMRLNI